MTGPHEVIVADDHELIAIGVKELLSSTPAYEVLATCRDGLAALQLIQKHRPKLAILDVAMPRLGGVEVARRVHGGGLPTRTVLLSMHDREAFVEAGFRAGASAYVLKEQAPLDLLDACAAALRGDLYRSRAVSGRAPTEAAARTGALSRREREVLRLVAAGLSNKEVAEYLRISPRTVETHRANLMEKLGIHTVAGLVRYQLDQAEPE